MEVLRMKLMMGFQLNGDPMGHGFTFILLIQLHICQLITLFQSLLS
jgi:hypothetical protein